MNSCNYYQELISRMLDDELSNKERAVLAEHLYICDECAAMYSAFSTVSDMVAADLVEPPEELAEDVMAHIRRAEIRKRNRQNTRATKNALVAAACVAFIVAAVGGAAVVKNTRSANVVYESRMSHSQAAATVKDNSIDAVIVSEPPAAAETALPQADTRYVAPVEEYTSAAQPQEEKPSFFASILPESWFSAAAPAATQSPVVYATPAATPFAQDTLAPRANSGLPPVVVVTPGAASPAVIVIETPEVTDVPLLTEAPVAETPVVTEAPAAETPVVTEAPAAETPAVTEAPVAETPAVTEAPVAETPVVTEDPMMAVPFVPEIPIIEMAPAGENFTAEAVVPELPVLEDSVTQDPAAVQSSTEGAGGPEAPAVTEHDFSMIDCNEFIMALFTSRADELHTETSTAPEEAAVQDGGAAQTEVASPVDKLLALNSVELSPLPENHEADRVDMLSFAQDGLFFSVKVSIYGENVYVFGYKADGSPVSFLSDLNLSEYNGMLQRCHEINVTM